MAITVERDDLENNKGLKITRPRKDWNYDLLEDVETEEIIFIHQSDIEMRRVEIGRSRAELDGKEDKLDALEAKLTQLWQNAS